MFTPRVPARVVTTRPSSSSCSRAGIPSPKWRTVALIAVVLPFWTNFLIRTYAWILLLNNAGWVNQWLQGLGLTDAPISMLYTPQAIVVGLVNWVLGMLIPTRTRG